MDVRLEQRFPGPLEVIEAALIDPAYFARLGELPKLGTPQLLNQERTDGAVRQRVRYQFVGELNAAVRRVVDPARLTWVEVANLDLRSHRTDWRIEPDHYASLLKAWGTLELTPLDDTITVRRAELVVRVNMPLVAGKVERAIASGMSEHAALEEVAMADWLAESGA